MMADTSLNRGSILMAFLYINSYTGCRKRNDDGSNMQNAKDYPEAFWGSIESMAKELSMPKDTINQYYRILAKCIHPDTGGSVEAMQCLNQLKLCGEFNWFAEVHNGVVKCYHIGTIF